MPSELEHARATYAERIRELAPLRNEALVRSLALVPREDFVGPGPWKLLFPAQLKRGYVITSDADPRHLYDNVLVALDASRQLNNGEPAALLRWLDSLDLRPGESFLHIGCGVGYYTAVAAAAVRPDGRVTGVEIDEDLAQRARASTAQYGDIEILAGDGSLLAGRTFDAIFVNAGATDILPAWLDLLAPRGRLLLPLTVSVPRLNGGVGQMVLVRRSADTTYTAELTAPVGIYHCTGARTEAGEERLRRALADPVAGVRALRRDPHVEVMGCWLHGERVCLSRP